MNSKLEELLRTEARKALDETIAEMLGRDADAEEQANGTVPVEGATGEPLKWDGGHTIYLGLGVGGHVVRTFATANFSARDWLLENKDRSLVRVLPPNANGDCPTEYVTTNDPWQPPPGTEWAIVRSGKTTERWRTRYATSTPWAVSPFYDHAARFETREEAETYIDGHGLTDAQPWPVPAS